MILKGVPAYSVFCLVIVLFAAAFVHADSFSSLEGYPFEFERQLGLNYANPDYAVQTAKLNPRIHSLVYPVLGFPSIVEPGDTIGLMVRYDDGDLLELEGWQAVLSTKYVDQADGGLPVGDSVGQSYPMQIMEASYDDNLGMYTVVAKVSPGTPMDNYHLLVKNGPINDYQPSAVSVQRNIDGTFRVVQITDAQLMDTKGEKSSDYNAKIYPYFDQDDPGTGAVRQAISEINLMRPAFAVMTGDLISGMDPTEESVAMYEELRHLRVPMFMVPGLRDGFATKNEDGVVIQDGHFYHRRTFGPTYFSFDYGDLHVICLNTYDGTQERRNTVTSRLFGRNAKNDGGQLSQQQLSWLEADARAATAAGKYIWVFMHHDPRGPYQKNKPLDVRGLGIFKKEWNYDGSGYDSDLDDDIFDESKAANTGVSAVRIFTENNVVAVFLGHAQEDITQVFDTGDEIRDADGKKSGLFAQRPISFMKTTSIGADPDLYWGYRAIEVTGNVITRTDFAQSSSLIESVPVGNVWMETVQGNDGVNGNAGMYLVNGYPRGFSGTARFFLPLSEKGYRAYYVDMGDEAGDIPFKDVGITEYGGVALYATVRAEGVGNFASFPELPYGESRPAIVVEPALENEVPVPAIEVLVNPEDHLNVQLRADGTTDADGDETIWRYDWFTGDGYQTSGRVVEHMYAKSGEYEVLLRVVDDHGALATATATVKARKTVSYDDDDDDFDICGLTPTGDSALGLVMLLGMLVWTVSRKRRTN